MKKNNKIVGKNVLYHFTQQSNVANILRHGLNTHPRTGFASYEGSRLFLWTELFTPALDSTLSLLIDERGKCDDYILLEIDISCLDVNRIFNDDAVAGHLACWTDQMVESGAVKVIGKLFDYF